MSLTSRKLRLRVLAGLGTIALMGGVTACAGGAAPAAPAIDPSPDASSVSGTITVMRNSAEISDDLIKEFNAEYPDVTVNAIDTDPVKLKAMQAAGDPPDIFRTEGPGVPPLVAQGQLMDLTEPLAAAGISADTAYEAADLYIVDGKRYGIPKDWSPDFTIFVNNKLFDEAGVAVPDPAQPLSWDEVSELAHQLTKKSGSLTTQFGLGGAWDTFSPARTLSALLAEDGQTLYSKDEKKIELSSNPEAIEILTFMADLAKEGVMHSPVNPSAAWSGEDFANGTIAMVVYGYWFNALIDSGDRPIGTDYTVLPAPYWSSPAQRVDPTITGTGYVMSSKTKNPDASWAFLKWYLTGKQAEDRAKAGFGLPVLTSNTALLPQERPVDAQAFEVVSREAEIAIPLQFNRYYDDSVFSNSYNQYLQSYIKGSMTIDEMASRIESDVNAAIQDGVSQIQ